MAEDFLKASIRRPRRPGTAQDHAAEWITHSIITGEYAPGDHIPQEDIASKIGVSLIPVRESMHRLEGLGQLTYKQQSGYFVAELTESQLIPMFELRKVLEDYALRKSLPLLGDEDDQKIAHYEENCRAALSSHDIVALASSHWNFFNAVLSGDKQPQVMRFLRHLWDATNAYVLAYYSNVESATRTAESRATILDAVRNRREELAIQAFDEHRDRTQLMLLSFLSKK
jgi:DNA-binding GntR family transcriptional regulator